MKCVKSETTIWRVSDTLAKILTSTGLWEFCRKREWKKSGRNRFKTKDAKKLRP